ncbi:hypothetical protein AB0L99_08370 [Streptomyces sp. NPDC051954]|uniref:hypothetical protein n=1 Tax=Streptomyces sp. NPDC051954 TaxID=3155524 RepID=UPI00342A2ED0
MTFIDPSRGAKTMNFAEMRTWTAAWDTYDSAVHGVLRMPTFYPVVRHENWWGCGVSLTDLRSLAREHGIPVAWVPPPGVLRRLVEADTVHAAKLKILAESQQEILDLCVEKHAECTDEWLEEEADVAGKALAAWQDGHLQAAAALALLGSEDLMYQVTRVARAKSYAGLKEAAQKEPDGWFQHAQYTLAPLEPLYTQYWPKNNDPLPESLSRHAVVHNFPLEHLNEGHSIVAVMLMISILRECQQRAEEVRHDMLLA